MKLYVAGPMRGLQNWNFEAFDKAAALYGARGHHVMSPAAIIRGMGYDVDHKCEPGTPDADAHLRHAILSDLLCICHCDGLVLLPGWEYSRGATVEVALGIFLGLKFYCGVEYMRELRPDPTPYGMPYGGPD